jgi:hypothetical protein
MHGFAVRGDEHLHFETGRVMFSRFANGLLIKTTFRQAQQRHNVQLSQDRQIVKHFFARSKTITSIVQTRFCGCLGILNSFMKVTIALTNFHICHRPQRQDETLDKEGEAIPLPRPSENPDNLVTWMDY